MSLIISLDSIQQGVSMGMPFLIGSDGSVPTAPMDMVPTHSSHILSTRNWNKINIVYRFDGNMWTLNNLLQTGEYKCEFLGVKIRQLYYYDDVRLVCSECYEIRKTLLYFAQFRNWVKYSWTQNSCKHRSKVRNLFIIIR